MIDCVTEQTAVAKLVVPLYSGVVRLPSPSIPSHLTAFDHQRASSAVSGSFLLLG